MDPARAQAGRLLDARADLRLPARVGMGQGDRRSRPAGRPRDRGSLPGVPQVGAGVRRVARDLAAGPRWEAAEARPRQGRRLRGSGPAGGRDVPRSGRGERGRGPSSALRRAGPAAFRPRPVRRRIRPADPLSGLHAASPIVVRPPSPQPELHRPGRARRSPARASVVARRRALRPDRQVAVSYALRYGEQYDAVWWISAADPSSLRRDYAALAQAVGLPEQGSATMLRLRSSAPVTSS